MKPSHDPSDWTLVPTTLEEIDAVRKKCRRLVTRRAALSAGVAAVPIPGIDIATDIAMLTGLIDNINIEFGLTPAQIDLLQPKLRLLAYEMIVGIGGVLVGKVVTRELVARLLKRTGLKIIVKHSARIIPFAGQAVSAAIGFATFRTIGNQHIEACAAVAAALSMRRAGDIH
jgi:hypothetical protein